MPGFFVTVILPDIFTGIDSIIKKGRCLITGMEYRVQNNMVIVSPDVSMDINGAPSVENELNRLLEDFPAHHFILNMRNVPVINSAGVGVFISLSGRLKKRNCQLKISNLNYIVRKVMDFLCMNDIIDIYDDEEDAINSFSVKI